MSRFFVAVWPAVLLIEQLRALERPARPGLRWTTEDQWHVTLRFFGSVDAAGSHVLLERLGELARATHPVDVRAGPAPVALGPGVWVLPVGGLEGPAARIAEVTRDVGRPPQDRPFSGHLTLARARRPPALVALPAPELDHRWTVTEITLVRSDLRADGARYQVVSRWPLGPE